MEKVLEFLEKTHRANWLLFTVCLTAVNTFVFYKINGELWNYSVGNNHPFFLFLEIALLSTGITRILVAINFLHWVQLCPIIADVINWCWWERRHQLKYWYVIISSKDEMHFISFCRVFRSLYYHSMFTVATEEDCRNCIEVCCRYEKISENHINNVCNIIQIVNNNIIKKDNSIVDITVPIYILHECYKKLYGFFLQKLWLKNGKFYAIISLIFAMVMVVI